MEVSENSACWGYRPQLTGVEGRGVYVLKMIYFAITTKKVISSLF
jgi:hypothetical protein